jgi:hypothetical protein
MAKSDKQCTYIHAFQKLRKTHITSEPFQLKNFTTAFKRSNYIRSNWMFW